MDLLNDVKFEKSDSEECHNNDVAAPRILYKRKMFGRQKTCMYLSVIHIMFFFKMFMWVILYALVSEASIYNPIDPEYKNTSRSKLFVVKFHE